MQTDSFYLGTLVRYLRDSGKLDGSLHGGKKNSKFSYQGCADHLNLKDRSQLTNLLDGDTRTHYAKVRNLFEEPVKHHIADLPQHLQRMAQEIYELDEADIGKILMKSAVQDQNEIENFCEKYAGTYAVWRYAGHLERTSRPYKTEEGGYGAWVVRAAVEIAAGNPHPTFRIRYKPQNTQNERDVSGLVLRVGNPGHIFFWGHEPASGYPLIMVAKHEGHGASRLEAMVIRKHEADRVFNAKVILERDPENRALEDLTVGMFKEHEVEEDIAEFRELMENETHMAHLVAEKCAIVL